MSDRFGIWLQSALDPRGPQAREIDFLWWLFLIVCTGVFVAVVVALALALFRPGRRERIEPGPGEPGKTRVVAVATGLTVLILIGFIVASVAASRSMAGPPPDRDPLLVDVIGHQWWWEVHYEDQVSSRRIVTANELRIPVGRPVVVRLSSRDVIHSFWVPNLHGKTDLVPGRTITTWFEADEPGVYRGQCAEFCGIQHAKMAFVVVAQPPDEFESWADLQRQPAAEPGDDLARAGRDVFLARQCSLCHTIRGTGAFGRVAPDLTHFGSRLTIAAGTLPNTRGHLGGWISDPQQVKPGSFMPATPLRSEELRSLLVYLESLQ